jgi:folate-dependent phosphoribosylglycinamide formyltransferase PurN
MRVVILCSSVYSETACAVAVRLAEVGYVPDGVLSLNTFSRGTLLRKLGQWGFRDVADYARTKLLAHSQDSQQLRNPYLGRWLKHPNRFIRSISDVAKQYGFPVSFVDNHNSPDSLARLKEWEPDVTVFTGGNILRTPLLQIPRLGVINMHLGLLPEIRGMNSPEWSLLTGVPSGVTIHYMDAGIDSGPILQKFEFTDVAQCASLSDLRHRLIAFGVEKLGEVVAELDHRAIVAAPQPDLSSDNQYYVMHEWLQTLAAEHLLANRVPAFAGTTNE